ncbi:digestive cysteine proteinase 1 [Cotesia glomerata]|uniref:digestive cysteine proteinase 1 n=1 Tax=Cotesia glomerata TaxID=32391 RepID=UPI001D01D226|nr:digestive cysteine proteinase 1 [Cotesia glomerata]XP_044577138.1 digestive cysteine proteinase 1 [Cotesia glomerata]
MNYLRIFVILFIGISCANAFIKNPKFSKKHLKSPLKTKYLTSPTFSNQYVTKGTLYIPYAEIKEPFYAWYDGELGSSRIDYYGGMVKTFQLSGDGSHGSSIKIAPMTTEQELNKESCFKIYGDDQMAIQPQTILPDTSGMQCIGEEIIDGAPCEKWRLVEKFGEKTNKYTLWIRYKKSVNNGVKQAIPVRYEMKGFNSLLGSHYDHYYLDYDWYSYETPDANVFQIASNMSCTSFPGPGDRHLYTFNPIHEFISNDHRHVDTEFEIFKRKHNKQYDGIKEHGNRKEIFRQNLRYIHSINRKNQGFQLAVNHLADRNDTELKYLRGKRFSPISYNGGLPFPHDVEKESAALPENHDWRLYGAVTPVKDQSVCGSCWSFGTTGAVEGAYFMKYKNLVRLSQQALIDCSWGYGNNGCDGGEDFRSYEWIMKHGGLPTEDEYGGYIGQDGYCHINNVTLTAKMAGFVNVTSGDPKALKVALYKNGPVSIAIDASQKAFSFYSNGVFYDAHCKNTVDGLDHAVLAVGWGSMNGEDYWLVKNSWSNYWGNDGYILMAQKDNNCGVLTAPTYVIAA